MEISREMMRQFQSEAADSLDALERALLELDKEPGREDALQTAFRAIHSIKGNSDYVGLKDINGLSHALEDLLDDARRQRLSLDETALSLLFQGVDVLREINARVCDEHYEEKDVSELLGAISEIKERPEPDTPTAPAPPRRRLDTVAVFREASAQHIEFVERIASKLRSGETMDHARGSLKRVLATFRTSANYVGASTTVALIEEMEREVSRTKTLDDRMGEFLSKKIEAVRGNIARLGVPPSGAAEAQGEPAPSAPVAPPKRAATRVDELLDRLSELILLKNTLHHLIQTAPDSTGSSEWRAQLRNVAIGLDRLSETMRHSVMSMRLVRFQRLFNRLPRMARDLAKQLGKEVSLSVSGGDVEVDAKVIEMLTDPMTHLIRNAIDHGVESPGERVAKGKAKAGRVSVSARQEGRRAIIEVRDDGAGLDLEAVRREALARNLADSETLESMSPDQLADIACLSGFSTSRNVTKISGRGVGLDVVKTNIRAMGGALTLSGAKDEGLCVRVEVPITMAMADVLLAEAQGQMFAIPFTCVMETLSVYPQDIRTLGDRDYLSYRGDILGVTHLGELLELCGKVRLSEADPCARFSVIVTAWGPKVRGIAVDRVKGRERALVRPLDPQLAHIREFSGAALMGDGDIALILDQMGLFQ
jgi:two-component system chemotaxis sensor kinase CheA